MASFGRGQEVIHSVTGPVVEIMKVNQATGEWAGRMVATVLVTKSSKY